jgi:hypothetical protein
MAKNTSLPRGEFHDFCPHCSRIPKNVEKPSRRNLKAGAWKMRVHFPAYTPDSTFLAANPEDEIPTNL